MTCKNIVFFSILSFLASCDFFSKKEAGENFAQTKKVARVFDSYLYFDQLPPIYKLQSGKDSIEVLSSFRSKWIKNQLLVHKAEDELEELHNSAYEEIQEKVENYKNMLLLKAYKDVLVSGKVDTSVSLKDISDFYHSDSASFIANDDLLKGFFIKVPANVPGVVQVKEQLGKEGAEKKIFSFCIRYAKTFRLNNWFPKQAILDESPFKFQDEKLPLNKLVEKSDTEFLYFLYIFEKVEKGSPTPLEYVKEDIRNLILSHRRVNAIEELEDSIYNEGKKSGNVEIF